MTTNFLHFRNSVCLIRDKNIQRKTTFKKGREKLLRESEGVPPILEGRKLRIPLLSSEQNLLVGGDVHPKTFQLFYKLTPPILKWARKVHAITWRVKNVTTNPLHKSIIKIENAIMLDILFFTETSIFNKPELNISTSNSTVTVIIPSRKFSRSNYSDASYFSSE